MTIRSAALVLLAACVVLDVMAKDSAAAPEDIASHRGRTLAKGEAKCCYAAGVNLLDESQAPRPKNMAFLIGAQKSGEIWI